MDFDAISEHIRRYRADGKRLFATSSFQTFSVVLLHVLSRIDRSIPVYMLDTGYLFPETLTYRDLVAERLGLTVHPLRSSTPKSQQRDASGRLLFASDPDLCCHLNKIQPLEAVLRDHDVWINGVRAEQNDNRRTFAVEEPTPQGAVRFHPLLDWTASRLAAYIREHGLPGHPLEDEGFLSIGCEPCTRRYDPALAADPRLARWFGLNKTECGLHTELVDKR